MKTENLFVEFVYEGADPTAWIESIEDYVERSHEHAVEVTKAPVDPESMVTLRDDVGTTNARAVAAGSHPFVLDSPILQLETQLETFTIDSGGERLDSFLNHVQLVYDATDPLYAFGLFSYQVDALDVEVPQPVGNSLRSDGEIESPTWLMALPPEMVEKYDREWLRSLPVERVEDLSDGGLLLVATENITDGGAVYEAMQRLRKAWNSN